MATLLKEGWLPLPCGAEVHLVHGVPERAWIQGSMPPGGAELSREVLQLTGLPVRAEDWQSTQHGMEFEAPLTVLREALPEVLRRLAIASAHTYYDRFHRPIGAQDTDWDAAAYAQDLDSALHFCGLHWNEVDETAFRDQYCESMHIEANRMTAQEQPFRLG